MDQEDHLALHIYNLFDIYSVLYFNKNNRVDTMGDLEDVRNTGLALALGSHEKPENHLQPDHQEKKKGKKEKFSLKYDNLFPSLTLGPSEVETTTTYLLPDTKMEVGKVCGESVDLQKQASSVSGVSSFSNSSSIKQERESGEEEVEVERVSSRVNDEDEEASPRKKLRLTKQQSGVLEDSFKEHATLNPVCHLSFILFIPNISAETSFLVCALMNYVLNIVILSLFSLLKLLEAKERLG